MENFLFYFPPFSISRFERGGDSNGLLSQKGTCLRVAKREEDCGKREKEKERERRERERIEVFFILAAFHLFDCIGVTLQEKNRKWEMGG